MKNELGREINGIGCNAHILNNCTQTTVDDLILLPIKFKTLIIQIHKYFQIYTVHKTFLKEFFKF